jgi:hypothetical protein
VDGIRSELLLGLEFHLNLAAQGGFFVGGHSGSRRQHEGLAWALQPVLRSFCLNPRFA